ncbi:hypothetical protein [uncultured Cyclobacterium sp.]
MRDRSSGSASFAMDRPIITEINFGHGAHAANGSSVGDYVGV